MVNTDKRAKMLRIAAVFLLIALILNASFYIFSIVYGEIQESVFSDELKSLFNPSDKEDFAKALSNFIMLPANVADIIISIIAVIMLFALKEKKAGVLLIVSSCIGIVFITATVIIMLTSTSDAESISALYAYLITTIIYQVLIILLGLLLCGVFKGGTKVAGFIIAGLFIAYILFRITLIILNIPESINEIKQTIDESGLTSYDGLITLVDYICGPFVILFDAVGMILCSFACALRPNKKKDGEVHDAG